MLVVKRETITRIQQLYIFMYTIGPKLQLLLICGVENKIQFTMQLGIENYPKVVLEHIFKKEKFKT